MFTKGEWFTSVHDDNCDLVVRAKQEYLEPIVANCSVDSCSQDDVEEIKANARLIAAAPKLLEACKELSDIFPEKSVSELDAADFKDRSRRIWTAAQAAKAAIASAESQS